MKKNSRALFLGVLLFVAASVEAGTDHWTSLGKHPLGEMSYNADSVILRDALITFWARRVYNQPQDSKISKMKFNEQRVFQELNCQKRTMRMIGMIFYDAKGKPTGAYKDLKTGAQPIQSSGFFEKEANLLCPIVTGMASAPIKTLTVPKAVKKPVK